MNRKCEVRLLHTVSQQLQQLVNWQSRATAAHLLPELHPPCAVAADLAALQSSQRLPGARSRC
jgi:hypothetical protein